MTRAFSPGNAFLSGEHAVGWGFPAVVASTSLGAFSESKRSAKRSCSISSQKYPAGSEELKIPLSVAEEFSGGKGFSVRVFSEIPPEGGLSSSTAVLTSIARSLPKGRAIPKRALLERLLPYQRALHGGRASGAEFASSIFGGFNRVSVSRGGRLAIRRIRARPLEVLVTDTGVRAPTRLSFGTHMAGLVKKDKSRAFCLFSRIGEISKRVFASLKSRTGREEKLAEFFRENQGILEQLGVSHLKIRKIASIAEKADPLSGTKLSGGGMGGVAITISPRLEIPKRALLRAGFSPKRVVLGENRTLLNKG